MVVRTHVVPEPDNVDDVVVAVVDDVKPKSETATPVTGWLNVAVYVSVSPATVAPLTRPADEKVGTTGVYLPCVSVARVRHETRR